LFFVIVGVSHGCFSELLRIQELGKSADLRQVSCTASRLSVVLEGERGRGGEDLTIFDR
jgi:hypothetical protein